MSAPEPMPSVRRRPIPGMTSQPETLAPGSPREPERAATDGGATNERTTNNVVSGVDGRPLPSLEDLSANDPKVPQSADPAATVRGGSRWPAADYSATRLANFRIPVDLHDRYRDLVRDAERRHPRLRRASLTEVLIALLEEGPRTPDAVAELIRRKRAAEHGPQA